MAISQKAFLGQWQQVEPDPSPETIYMYFEEGGRLTYSIEGETLQEMYLTWRIDGDRLISDQPSAPRIESTKFRFLSPSRLKLSRDDEEYVYERVG